MGVLLVSVLATMEMTMEGLVERIKQFLNDEARSSSMDYGCVTPQYVSRMWGGSVPMDEIAEALKEAKRQLI